MTGQLITLPARLSARGVRVLLHTVEDVTGMALMGTLRVAGAVGNLRSNAGGGPVSTPTRPTPAPGPDPRSAASPPARRAPTNGAGTATRTRPTAPPAREAPESGNGTSSPLASERLETEGRTVSVDLDSPAPAAPDHVSEDPVVVREEAEPGAQDGAGASVSVDAPWEGYERMAARDIVARLAACSTAELAAVALYEGSHRKRRTVLTAVERELAGPGH